MRKQDKIYLDNNATTPCDPRVVDAMLPFFTKHFGNAASRSHPFGWEAAAGVDKGRQQIADLLKVDAKEIVFTSGATESNNLALKGVYEMYHRKGNHIITLETEHKAVLDPCENLRRRGADITYLPVGEDGIVDLDLLEKSIKKETVLVAIMWANNETGVIQPIKEIGNICAKHDIFFMSDATQAVGKIPTFPREMGIHLMAFTAHKMYGPKGVGALYISSKSPKVRLLAQSDGGGHERGMRSGTLNVSGIVGFGKAAAICQEEMEKEATRLLQLRDRLESSLIEKIEATAINGSITNRMSHVSNIRIKHIVAERLMGTFNYNLAVSSGSACTSASTDPSHVLLGLGIDEDAAHSSLRFSLGRFTKEEEIDMAIKATIKGVVHLRSISPRWAIYKEEC